jgi:hypothetical protein
MVSSVLCVVEIELPHFSVARRFRSRGAELDWLYAVGGICIVFRAFSPIFRTRINETHPIPICKFWDLYQTFNVSKKQLFLRQELKASGGSEHFTFALHNFPVPLEAHRCLRPCGTGDVPKTEFMCPQLFTKTKTFTSQKFKLCIFSNGCLSKSVLLNSVLNVPNAHIERLRPFQAGFRRF